MPISTNPGDLDRLFFPEDPDRSPTCPWRLPQNRLSRTLQHRCRVPASGDGFPAGAQASARAQRWPHLCCPRNAPMLSPERPYALSYHNYSFIRFRIIIRS